MTTDETAVSLRGKRDPAAAWVPVFALGGIGTVLLFVLWSGLGVVPSIELSPSAIRIGAKGYGHTIAYAQIDSVTLRSNLDGVGNRRNALQSGNVYAGVFAMVPYGTATLFVDTRRRPFVVIHARDDVMIASARDSAAAVSLAESLTRAATAAHRVAVASQ